MLPVSIVAVALIALLAIVPVASAATPNPVASATTTLTIKSSVMKSLKKAGVKLTAVKPAKLKGSKLTLTVNGGEIEAATGKGIIAHGGGLKIKAGKKSVTLKSFSLNSKNKSLSAKVGGKNVKLAALASVTSSRLGFGNSIAAKKVKLTSAGDKALNKALAPAKKKGQKAPKPAFKANTVLGSSTTQVEPLTDNVLPTGTMTFAGSPGLLGKLAKAEVKVELIAPTTEASILTYNSPLSGGTISPLGTSGTVNSSGGLKLTQKLKLEALGQEANTSITLGSIGVDLAAKTSSVEVIGESTFVEPGSNPAKKPLNLGNLGRSSIADLTISSTPNPATRTVAVSATGAIQPVAAEVLNGFVKVHEISTIEKLTPEEAEKAYIELVLEGATPGPETEAKAAKIGQERAEKKAAEEAKELEIKSGETLGTYSFVATGE